MKPVLALFCFMLSTVALFLQPTPNPQQFTTEITNTKLTEDISMFDQPVEYLDAPLEISIP